MENLAEVERTHLPTVNEDFRRMFLNKIVKLDIIETSRLELDPNVMHPFVKAHVINKDNGAYLKRDGNMG